MSIAQVKTLNGWERGRVAIGRELATRNQNNRFRSYGKVEHIDATCNGTRIVAVCERGTITTFELYRRARLVWTREGGAQ